MADGTGPTGTGDASSAEPSFMLRMTLGGIEKKWPKAKQLSTESLYLCMKEQGNGQDEPTLLILDTREKEEYIISHIPGAVLVSGEAEDIEKTIHRLHNTKNKKQWVVCYCSLGYRSCRYATYLQHDLKKEGNKSLDVDVYNLEGSLFQWANEGRGMKDGEEKDTIYCHPYSSIWGQFLNSKLRKWTPT